MSPRRARHAGCSLDRTGVGKLAFRFRWTGPDGRRRRYSISTTLADTEENRRQLEPKRLEIGAEIRAGTFDPLRHFRNVRWPFGMGPRQPETGGTLADRIKTWIDGQDIPTARRNRIRDYRSHLKNYFRQHRIGTLDPASITEGDLKEFQRWLLTKAGVGRNGVEEKTAANVIRGTLRAFMRDTKLPLEALEALRWERYRPTRVQDPFELAERDELLGWFRTRRPFDEYVSLALRFCGVSPSETRGLCVADFDRRTSSLRIERSQHLGHTGATKAQARERPVLLDEETTRAVSTLAGIRKGGEPLLSVAEDTLRDNFTKAQVSLGIRHRSLYQAKHTYAVHSLEDPAMSPAIVARNLGISLATLEKHYAAALRRRIERLSTTIVHRTSKKR